MLRLHGDTLAALKAAQRSEQRYELAADGSNDGIWDWDVAADALYCSPSLEADDRHVARRQRRDARSTG